jgi:hypothetical protein
MRIGLDFDNTIVCYDDVFWKAAQERGLVGPDLCGSKRQLRDFVRSLPDGEVKWQALQGHVYGRGIEGAVLFSGVPEFLRRSQAHGDTILIVSHKSEHGHFDRDEINLRSAALSWMETNELLSGYGVCLRREHVHFTSTRAEKLERIAELSCDVFIDDLEEILLDPRFAYSVRRILLSKTAIEADGIPYSICRDWLSISELIFRDGS